MPAQSPFSLRIFVANGDPDCLRLVERSNWIGKALVFPRPLLPSVRNRPEFQHTGVYLLLGPHPEGDGEMLYVGEGDPVRPRLEDHYARKDFWNRAVFFAAGLGQLNKAHVQYLEAQLIARANAAKRISLDNGNQPNEPTLSEPDRADMDVFLENILGILPVLGIQAFDLAAPSAEKNSSPLLTCSGKGITANGRETVQGFVVLAGSLSAVNEVESFKEWFPNLVKMRAELLKNGVLVDKGDHLLFTQNFTFTSPSAAAAVVLARSSNGRVDWKDATGRTLKEIQEAQAKE